MLAALPAAERSTAFLELWTAKEAVLKATGRGIAFGLHRLQVTREPPRLTWLDGDDANAWQLQRLQMWWRATRQRARACRIGLIGGE